jgi:ACS family D-galactonate transporter-like MFS transporter
MARTRTGVRWLVISMAFLGTTISYVDRACLGVAIPFIEHDLKLDPRAVGAVLGAFFWTYALGQLPCGWLVDRVGARLSYAGAMLGWSLFTAATSLANGFASLFGLRLLLGAGEAPAYPTNAKVVAEWFPARERAIATSIFDNGARVGSALALPVVSAAIYYFGWRASFVVTGSLGIAWAVAWYAFYRRPAEHRWVSDAERKLLEPPEPATGAGPASAPVRWRDLFRHRTVWGMMLGFFCLSFEIYFFITWFPAYLVHSRGFTLLKLGLYGTIPALFAIPCGYLGGFVSDTLLRRGLRLTWARKIPIVAGMTLASSIALAVSVPSAAWALALLSLCYGSLTFAAASVWSLPADVAPSLEHVGSIGGIQNFASNLAGVGVSNFVGVMLAETGSFVAALWITGAFALLGAGAYLFLVGEIEPLGRR